MKSFGVVFTLACCACLLITTTSSTAHQRPVVADQLRVSGVPVARPQEGLTTRSAVRLLLPMRQLLASADLLPGTAGRTASTDQPSTTDIAAGMVAPTSVVTSAAEVHARSYLQQQAVRFVENRGQIADTDGRARADILYTADAKGAQLYFRKDGVSYVFTKHEEEYSPSGDMGAASTAGAGPRRPRDLHAGERAASMVTTYRMDMHLVGARTDVRVRANGAVEGVDNYYLAHCPDGVLGVQSFTRIVYENVYAHIDLEYLTSGGRMKYNFIVHPGGNVADIRMRFSGASSMAVDEDGDLHIETPLGSIEEAAPVTYQQAADTRRGIANEPVHSSYNLHEHDLTFEVAPYDPTRTLIIDPWATYYGGSDFDWAYDIATDGSGNVVITGLTYSKDFPVAGAWQSPFAEGFNDAFVVKLDAGGARLWATYYGGSGEDAAHGIATDVNGNVVITGGTGSSDFPVAGAVQTSIAGDYDAFVVKLDPDGSRLWATYYGGSEHDRAGGIATDGSGNVVVTGWTDSDDFPVTRREQPSLLGGRDAFVVKLHKDGARFWATYYGGSGGDTAYDIATDVNGNVVITGSTSSSDFPVASAVQSSLAGDLDAFVVKLDAGGARLWATYYGGSGGDGAHDIATDVNGNVVITGWTSSSDFPVASAVQSAYAGDGDAFVVKLDAGGACLWATYYGGSVEDEAEGIATDGSGDVVITGWSFSDDFPVAGAVQFARAGQYDAFVLKLDADGARLWATYYGGWDSDRAYGIATDGNGNVVISGFTSSRDFPVAGAVPSAYAGDTDAFIVHLTSDGTMSGCVTTPTPSIFGDTAACASATEVYATDAGMKEYAWTLTPGGRIVAGGSDTSHTVTVEWLSEGMHTVAVNYTDSNGCRAIAPTTVKVSVIELPRLVQVGDERVCSGMVLPERAFGDTAPGRRIEWTNNNPAIGLPASGSGNLPAFVARLLGSEPLSATIAVTPYSTVGGKECMGGTMTFTITVVPEPDIVISAQTSLVRCKTEEVVLEVDEVHQATYEWYCDGILLTGESTRLLRTRRSGAYVARLQTADGCVVASAPVMVIMVDVPRAEIVPEGPLTFCEGNDVVLRSAVETGYSWQWYRDGSIIGGAVQAQYRASMGGLYQVRVSLGSCDSLSPGVLVVVEPRPSLPVAVSGPTLPCVGTQVMLRVNSASGWRHQWSRNNGIIPGAESPVHVVTTGGTYFVRITTPEGCVWSSDSIVLTFIDRVQVGTVSGPRTSNTGELTRYTLSNPSTGTDYVWSVTGGFIRSGQSSPSIEVEWGLVSDGIIAVHADADCSDTARVHVTVDSTTTIEALPTSHGYELYPNPSAGDVVLAIPLKAQGRMHEVEMFDMIGRLVHREHIPAGRVLHGLSTGLFPDGVYRVMLRVGREYVHENLLIRR